MVDVFIGGFMTKNNIIYLNKKKPDSASIQRFYLFDARQGQHIHSVVDVNSLLELFNTKHIELSDECMANLDAVLMSAADDCFENGKLELPLHQLLTVSALYCSTSNLYKEFRSTHDQGNLAFSYFLAIIPDGDEFVVVDLLLEIDYMVTGDLLDDIIDGMAKRHLELKSASSSIQNSVS